MNEEPLTAAATMALLRENAARLVAAADGQPPKRLHTAPEPDAWSPNDVLAHIRACCQVWGENMARILAEDRPTYPGRNPRTWMKQSDYLEWAFDDALRAFSAKRRDLLRTLKALTPDQWERTATVRSYGQSNERTLRSYASYLATHERGHMAQIERALTAGPKK